VDVVGLIGRALSDIVGELDETVDVSLGRAPRQRCITEPDDEDGAECRFRVPSGLRMGWETFFHSSPSVTSKRAVTSSISSSAVGTSA
jgi:hypothetical protein